MKYRNPRQWDSPAMRRALADPANRTPLKFPDLPIEDFEIDEKEHIDRQQAADLERQLRNVLTPELTEAPDRGILKGSPDCEEDDDDA